MKHWPAVLACMLAACQTGTTAGEAGVPSPSQATEGGLATRDANVDDSDQAPSRGLPMVLDALQQGLPLSALLDEPAFQLPLSAIDAVAVADALWREHASERAAATRSQYEDGIIQVGEDNMPFHCEQRGGSAATGQRLFISMHGGGSTAASVNDSQWQNQQRLYFSVGEPMNGLYCAPRAPADAWDMWFQTPTFLLIERFIEVMVLHAAVDPDQVYLMGYSAGGDGTYQLATKMPDRFAGAAMSAGHPNDSVVDNLMNLPFSLWVGAGDTAFNRAKVGMEFAAELDQAQSRHSDAYLHASGFPDTGHWMKLEDAAHFEFLRGRVRNPTPGHLIWERHDERAPRPSSYWLRYDGGSFRGRVEARYEGQDIHLISDGSVENFTLLLRDDMVDLDRPVRVLDAASTVLFESLVPRTARAMLRSILDRHDPRLVFFAELAL